MARTPERNFLYSVLEGTRRPGGKDVKVTKAVPITTKNKNNKKITDWITPKVNISGVERVVGICVTVGVADPTLDQDVVVQHVKKVLGVGVLAIEWEGGAHKHHPWWPVK